MDLFEDLKVLGVNIDDGLRRLNGNATLYCLTLLSEHWKNTILIWTLTKITAQK